MRQSKFIIKEVGVIKLLRLSKPNTNAMKRSFSYKGLENAKYIKYYNLFLTSFKLVNSFMSPLKTM